jgi:hypothetical protein
MNDEQKAALDLAVLNLKTHGDDQLLRAVQPLIEYYEARALLSDGGKGEAVAWLIDWPDEPELGHYFGEEPGGPDARSRPLGFITAPQAECAASDASAQPVAWQYQSKATDEWFQLDAAQIEWHRNRGYNVRPLYTGPAPSDAQAECAPRALTDEEIYPLIDGCFGDKKYHFGAMQYIRFVRAIEQAMNKGAGND